MRSVLSNKVIITVVLLLVSLLVLTLIYHLVTNRGQAETVQRMDQSISIAEGFDSIEELRDGAELIVLISVENTKNTALAGASITISEAEVIEILKGDELEQRTIQLIDSPYGEHGVLQENEQAVVFLKQYIGSLADDAYVILGVYQGKFLVQGENIILPKGSPISAQLGEMTSKEELLHFILHE